jgi:hypothetical protein
MVAENPTWGAPRIHGELKMLGFDISERTLLRWMRKAPRNSDTGKAMGGLSEQSSESHRCDGFLHRADARVRHSFLRDQHTMVVIPYFIDMPHSRETHRLESFCDGTLELS